MKMDDIRKYIDLRDSLVREKQELEERLRQINEALGQQESSAQSSSPAPAAKPSYTPRPAAGGRRGRPSRSGVSLRDAVLEVTSSGPKTKQEILDGVASLGYRFSTKNPLNSLGVILYGKNPKFKNDNGRFSPVGGGSSASSGASSSAGAFGRKKRQMSPEARERIAAAQRARWAKTKNK